MFHQSVRTALIKEGWTITSDPLVVQFGDVDLYIDLGAEKLIAAEKEGRHIAVEIKRFLGPSLLNGFHTALSQFLNYRLALESLETQRILYLAVPTDAYSNFFSLPFAQAARQRHSIAILVYDPHAEETTQWIS